MTERLVVWLGTDAVADLSIRRGQLQLAYRPQVVADLGVGTVCLSVSLPVDPAPYRGDHARNWCEGVLPEGETRTLLERMFGVRRGDTFGLLAAIGNDCAGAVSFLPEGQAPGRDAPTVPMDLEQVARAIRDLPEHPLGADHDVRVSLGGLQAKLLLVRVGQGWAHPSSGRPSTHIVKPDPADPRLAGLVGGEALVLRACALAGLPAAHVELHEWADRQVLLVERYDRRVAGDSVIRTHQEDGCQALRIAPDGPGKYQGVGSMSPSYGRLAAVLRDHGADADAQLARLGAAMTATIAVGNTDAHARNHSFLLSDGAVELAPMYDVAPTALFLRNKQLALWVDDQAMLDYVTRAHIVAEMHAWGLPVPLAQDVVERTVVGLEQALPRAAHELAGVSEETADRTLARIRRLIASSSVR